tara:strand:+ start:2789 stop:2962 length:174 start_codon:yes stop_codon:yes gene_type:complete
MDFKDIKETIQSTYDDVLNELNIRRITEVEKLKMMKTKDKKVKEPKLKKSKKKKDKD